VTEVKALACELASEKGVPLSRWSSAEIAREAVKRGIVAEVSGATVWRWLSADATRAMAAPLLDLSARPALRRARQPDPRPLPETLGG